MAFKSNWLRSILCFTLIVSASLLFFYFFTENNSERIKVGLVTTLTGPASTAGILTRDGALLAIEQANKAGGVNGRQIEAIIRDDKASAEEALRIDQSLIDEGVVAFLGHYLSSVSVKVVPLMNERGLLMLSLGAATGDLYGIDDSFVRICLPNNVRATLAARESYQRLGIRKAAVVYDLSNSAYTQSAYELYKAELERLGGEVVGTVTFDARKGFDAPAIAEELSRLGADGVYVLTNALHGALICQHLRTKDKTMPIVMGAWASVVPEFISYGGQAVEGVYSIIECNFHSTNPNYLAFKQAYQTKYGAAPTLHAQNAYDLTNILLKTLEKTTDPKKIKDELISLSVFQGVDGPIRIDRYGEPLRPVYLMQVQNGQMLVVDTIASRTLSN